MAIDDFDDAGCATKVMSGQWNDINKADVMSITESIIGFIPGYSAIAAGTGVSAIGENWRAASKRERLEVVLGLRHLEGYEGHNDAITQGLDNINKKKRHTVATSAAAGVGALGGIAGATALGTAIFPGIGTLGGLAFGIAGSFIGGTAASKVYNMVMEEKTEDVLELTAKIRLAQMQAREQAQQTGQPVDAGIPEEAVFAAMVINLPEKKRQKVIELTGIDNFSELVANNDLDKLRKAMNNARVDDILRTDSGVFQYAPEEAGRSVASQIAARINNGAIDANELLFNQEKRLE